MDEELTIEEEQRMGQLQQGRLVADLAENEVVPIKKTKLSFWNKVSQHWLILVGAAFFDLLALIPFLDVVVNFIFGLVLFLYFGPKKKTAGSELL